ncbi:MAG: HlyD family efflux transporter periplasmic adaptor subunit [Verrucomicrobia bacterium]|nr:HlyD family efflux transporter periplasmic adaptor subunit [Verrucomicrobiota bacterium]
MCFLGLLLAGCSQAPSDAFQGYVEGEFVYVASPLAGALTNLAVSRGLDVKAGQLLFELEREAEAAAAREAEQRLVQAKARLENLTKGRRPTEIESIKAQLDRAKANLQLSELDLERRKKLSETKVISEAELDSAKARRDADQASVLSLTADLDTARLGARVDEIKAAEADVQATQAALTRASWALAQKSQSSPTNARVHDTLYRAGEFVPAGTPVVALLPPANLKVRFFVPQARLASIRPGTAVSVSLDGVAQPLRATVNYISTQAEFTPPVIYSMENRAKLVFMIEAVFAADEARNLKPGQPVDVRLSQ